MFITNRTIANKNSNTFSFLCKGVTKNGKDCNNKVVGTYHSNAFASGVASNYCHLHQAQWKLEVLS
jgi:hypothetical protein